MSKEKLEFVEPVDTNTDNEYSREPVPLGARKSCFSLTIVWTGFVFLVTSMMAGGGLAAGLTFNELLLAMILGNIFLCIIAGLVSVIAYKTGLTFALLTRYSFGQEGSRIASLFVPIVNLGWYTIQAALYGHFIAQVFQPFLHRRSHCDDAQCGYYGDLCSSRYQISRRIRLYCDSVYRIPFTRNSGSFRSNNRWLARTV